jgi:hypothetical protein
MREVEALQVLGLEPIERDEHDVGLGLVLGTVVPSTA